jgi:hypothetical protein
MVIGATALWWAVVAATAVAILWLERRPPTFPYALADGVALYGLLHLVVARPLPAALATFLVVGVIGGTSKIKARFDAHNLLFGDLRYVARTYWAILLRGYGYILLPALGLLVVAAWLAGAAALLIDDRPTPLTDRAALAALGAGCAVAVHWLSGGSARWRLQVISEDRAHFSAFVASLLGAGPSHRPAFVDIDSEPIELSQPLLSRPTAGSSPPDIIFILHESTFDPRTFGFAGAPGFADLFDPPGGIGGALHVDVFGGGTWQTEFSAFVGLSSLCFGRDGRFVTYTMVDRLKHALPSYLAGLGYRTVMISCDDESSGASRFYRSIGFQEVCYPATLPAPFDLTRWRAERHDALMLTAGCDRWRRHADESDQPLFLAVTTLMNHGPHHRRLFPDDRYAVVRAEAYATSGRADFAEYCVRLAETADAVAEARRALADRRPRRPLVIVHFGDHQPTLTRRLVAAAPDNSGLRRTFYAIEGVNYDLPAGLRPPGVLDAAFLGTVALEAAGLPLDAVFATRASLLDECGADYFGCESRRKRRFHRALVDRGLVDLA